MQKSWKLVFIPLATIALAAVGCGEISTPADSTSAESSGSEAPAGAKADYFGEDDRRDPYHSDVTDRQRRWARSTALVVHQREITESSSGELSLDAAPFNRRRNLCDDVAFAEQPTVGGCSSFLAAPDTVVTAGHCLNNSLSCDDARFVFEYGYFEEGEDPTQVSSDQVYRCEEVVDRRYEGDELEDLDYAVIRLDRAVEDREPLEIRRQGRLEEGDRLTLIGNPDGLPTKIDAGGEVFHTESTRFVATNDSFAGHSGGVVLNNRTGVVEAVHVDSQGPRFVEPEGEICDRLRRCEEASVEPPCQGSVGVYASEWRELVVGGE